MSSTTTDPIIPREDRVNGLHPNHLADLRRSGLTDETIRAAGITSEHDHRRLAVLLNRKSWPSKYGAAMVIPFRDAAGDIVLRRVKPDNPPLSKGKPCKYLQPGKTPIRPYIPPGVFDALDDPTVELIVTEGEKKSLAGTQWGFSTIGLTGVDCWHEGKSSLLLPDLQRVCWNGRKTIITFDSDTETNEQIKASERMLAAVLGHKGAVVRIAHLPGGPNGEKVGLDDFLVAHGPAAFRKLLDEAEDPQPPQSGELLQKASEMYFEDEAAHMLAAGERDKLPTIRFYRGGFWRWKDGSYREIPDAEMRARVTSALSPLRRATADRAGFARPPHRGFRRWRIEAVREILGRVHCAEAVTSTVPVASSGSVPTARPFPAAVKIAAVALSTASRTGSRVKRA
jgi:putative DNA primase/helicase